jgi:feruloyl esterase
MHRARLALIVAIACVPVAAHAASCESLEKHSVSGFQVTSVTSVKPGAFAEPASLQLHPDLPAFCRVVATARPTADSSIGIEVWLPASGWNGKFLAVGSGGWGGAIAYDAMGDAL